MNPEACMDAESTADDHKPQVISLHHPCLFLSLPPCGLGAITQEATLEIFPPPPPPLHPPRWGMSSRCDSSQDVEQAPVSCLHLFPPVLIPDRGFLEPGNWPAQLTDGQRGRKRGLALPVSTSKFPSQPLLPEARQRRWLLNSNWSVLLLGAPSHAITGNDNEDQCVSQWADVCDSVSGGLVQETNKFLRGRWIQNKYTIFIGFMFSKAM